MPSGYTQPLYEGTEIGFDEFMYVRVSGQQIALGAVRGSVMHGICDECEKKGSA